VVGDRVGCRGQEQQADATARIACLHTLGPTICSPLLSAQSAGAVADHSNLNPTSRTLAQGCRPLRPPLCPQKGTARQPASKAAHRPPPRPVSLLASRTRGPGASSSSSSGRRLARLRSGGASLVMKAGGASAFPRTKSSHSDTFWGGARSGEVDWSVMAGSGSGQGVRGGGGYCPWVGRGEGLHGCSAGEADASQTLQQRRDPFVRPGAVQASEAVRKLPSACDLFAESAMLAPIIARLASAQM
jgi:hypothetical protein